METASANSKGEVIIYQTEDGLTKLNVQLENESVWLTQEQMTLLFDRDKSTISRHISNIFSEGELNEKSVVAFFATTSEHGALFQRIESLEEFRMETRRSLQEVNERFDNLLSKMDDDLYHFGASFNELGKRLFAFDKMGLDKNLSQL